MTVLRWRQVGQIIFIPKFINFKNAVFKVGIH